MTTQIFVVNKLIGSEARTEIKNGVEWMVVPGVPVIAQVLGDVLLPGYELGKFPGSWNGIPLTFDHPDTPDGSANHPDVKSIGKFFEANVSNEQLRGEYWFDVSALNETGEYGEILTNKIKNGETVETSTGYWADIEQKVGVHKSKRYEGIYHNLRPDHIAVLLFDTGKCNVKDGCGFPRLNKNKACVEKFMKNAEMSVPRTPSYNGTEDNVDFYEIDTSLSGMVDAYFALHGGTDDSIKTFRSLTQPMKDWIASLTLLGDPQSSSWWGLTSFPVVNPVTFKLNKSALLEIAEAMWLVDYNPALVRKAEDLLESEFRWQRVSENRARKLIDWLMNLMSGHSAEIQQEDDPMATKTGGAGEATAEAEEILEVETPVENPEETPKETPRQNTSQATNAAGLSEKEIAELRGIAGMVGELGGIEATKNAILNVQSGAARRRDSLVEAVVNANAGFTKDELKAVPDGVLEKIASGLAVNREYVEEFDAYEFLGQGRTHENVGESDEGLDTFAERPSLMAALQADKKE